MLQFAVMGAWRGFRRAAVAQRNADPVPRKVRLHAGPNEAVGPAIALLGRWFELDGVVIGGGTALETRWHHRRSTDLDLFAPLPYLSNLLRVPRIRFERELAAQARGERANASAGLAQMHTVISGVPVSLSGTRGFWKEDHDPCVEASTGMPLAPSADILLRKMQGRVLSEGRAVPRDAYDFVVAHSVDPASFRDAIAQLDEDQSNAIADTFEALADEPPTREGRSVEEPTYPDVLEQGLWRLAAQVFRHPQQEVKLSKRVRSGEG